MNSQSLLVGKLVYEIRKALKLFGVITLLNLMTDELHTKLSKLNNFVW